MMQSARGSAPATMRRPAQRATTRTAGPAGAARTAASLRRIVAAALRDASPPSAEAPTTTVDCLDLLVPSPPTPAARPRPVQQPQAQQTQQAQAQAWWQPEQQKENRAEQQQQPQRQQQQAGNDFLGRPPLPPGATDGTALDALLMSASLVALVFLSMELYRLFAFVAYSPGFAAWRETVF